MNFRAGIAVCLALLCSCAVVRPRTHLVMAQDATVTIGSNAPQSFATGERVSLPHDEPVLVEAPARVSVLVVPLAQSPDELKINLRSVDDPAGPSRQSEMDRHDDELVLATLDIQRLATERRLPEAQQRLRSLQEKFPQLVSLGVLDVNLALLQGQTGRAREAIKVLNTRFPDDKRVRQLASYLESQK